MSAAPPERRSPPPGVLLPVAGVAIGFVGSLCGIGGGLFSVPLLHYVLGLRLTHSVATALVLVLATTSSSTVGELLREESALDPKLLGLTVLGILVGAQAGFWFSERIAERPLRKIFVVVLFLAGLRVLFSSSGGVGGAELSSTLGLLDYTMATAAGLGGGFVAPLLGVGGGLIMVPVLFLGVSTLGFDGARATSLAAGVVGSARSLFLHSHAGGVEWRAGLLLAAGALVGANVGIQTLSHPGVIEVGRVLLGLILWFVAGRFLVDLRARE